MARFTAALPAASAVRRTAWPCRRQRKYIVLLAFVPLFACLHLFAIWDRLFATGQERPGTAGDRAVDGGQDTVRLSELGVVGLMPPPPSSQREKVIGMREVPFQVGVRPLNRAYRVHGEFKRSPNAGGKSPAEPGHPRPRRTSAGEKRPVDPFPWPARQNFIPNYFLNYRNATSSSSSSSSSDAKLARFDESSVLVYLHHNKAAGTTTKKCLATIASAVLGRSTGPVLSSEGRLAVEARFARNKRFGMGNSPNTYVGGYAFGLCDRYRKPCAYFTVMRDPYERTLSSYSYCKHARHDQLCAAQVASSVSLREWALHQGSFFFRQLLFQPEFCSDKTRWVRHIDIDAVPHEFLKDPDSLRSSPCWFREKLIMELTLNQTQHEGLLQHCLDNLERWFTVIMLVGRYEESLQMAQEAFKLPMYDLCAGRHENTGSYMRTVNPVKGSRVDPQNRTSATHPASDTPSVEAQLLELRQDPEVQRILRADDLLYQKGVEIFNKQREMFNKIRSRT